MMIKQNLARMSAGEVWPQRNWDASACLFYWGTRSSQEAGRIIFGDKI